MGGGSAGAPAMGGQCTPEAGTRPHLGAPWASAQSSARPLQPAALLGPPHPGLSKGHTCSSHPSPRTCLICPEEPGAASRSVPGVAQ